jgi:hypothetical protein
MRKTVAASSTCQRMAREAWAPAARKAYCIPRRPFARLLGASGGLAPAEDHEGGRDVQPGEVVEEEGAVVVGVVGAQEDGAVEGVGRVSEGVGGEVEDLRVPGPRHQVRGAGLCVEGEPGARDRPAEGRQLGRDVSQCPERLGGEGGGGDHPLERAPPERQQRDRRPRRAGPVQERNRELGRERVPPDEERPPVVLEARRLPVHQHPEGEVGQRPLGDDRDGGTPRDERLQRPEEGVVEPAQRLRLDGELAGAPRQQPGRLDQRVHRVGQEGEGDGVEGPLGEGERVGLLGEAVADGPLVEEVGEDDPARAREAALQLGEGGGGGGLRGEAGDLRDLGLEPVGLEGLGGGLARVCPEARPELPEGGPEAIEVSAGGGVRRGGARGLPEVGEVPGAGGVEEEEGLLRAVLAEEEGDEAAVGVVHADPRHPLRDPQPRPLHLLRPYGRPVVPLGLRDAAEALVRHAEAEVDLCEPPGFPASPSQRLRERPERLAGAAGPGEAVPEVPVHLHLHAVIPRPEGERERLAVGGERGLRVVPQRVHVSLEVVREREEAGLLGGVEEGAAAREQGERLLQRLGRSPHHRSGGLEPDGRGDVVGLGERAPLARRLGRAQRSDGLPGEARRPLEVAELVVLRGEVEVEPAAVLREEGVGMRERGDVVVERGERPALADVVEGATPVGADDVGRRGRLRQLGEEVGVGLGHLGVAAEPPERERLPGDRLDARGRGRTGARPERVRCRDDLREGELVSEAGGDGPPAGPPRLEVGGLNLARSAQARPREQGQEKEHKARRWGLQRAPRGVY